mmetsp:Transcript_66601/g.134250  ORF Transcript_66601/g.134250 Transcript_66601/m.134250 type:complete len:410 (+) Transcript_66601:420-1649(+)
MARFRYSLGTRSRNRCPAMSVNFSGMCCDTSGSMFAYASESSGRLSSSKAMASVHRLMAKEMRCEKSGRDPGRVRNSRNSSSASRFASSRSRTNTSSTSSGFTAANSVSLKSMELMISNEEQMTPHLFAEESLTMGMPVSACMASRAAGVRNKLAPSTMSLLEGVPSGFKYCRQFPSWMVAGRPPAGMNASAGMRLCMVLRARRASSAALADEFSFGSTTYSLPSPKLAFQHLPSSSVSALPLEDEEGEAGLESLLRSKAAMGSSFTTKRISSAGSNPLGSSAHPVASASPTTRQSLPYSLCKILIMFPATSPSGPPVILTVKDGSGAPAAFCWSGCICISRRATSRNTCTPSEVTPYVLWLMPCSGLLLMNAEGIGYPRWAALDTIQLMSSGITCSSGPRYTSSSFFK